MSKNNNKNSPSSGVNKFILDGVQYTTQDDWKSHVDSSGTGWKVPVTNTENENQCTAPSPVGLRSSKTSWEVPINPGWKKNNVTELYSTSKNNEQDNKQKEDKQEDKKSKNPSNGL